MTEEISDKLLSFLNNSIKNVIVNLENVEKIDEDAANTLIAVQQTFYDQNNSLVICCIQPEVEKFLDERELLELMNTTPTQSEAWDIVQMEEIERELL